MEGEIGKIASDTRADKARERQYHYMVQQVQQGEQNEEREDDLRKEDIAEPNVDMNDVIVENVVQDNYIDAPASRSDIRVKSPDRKKAAKRGTDRHDENLEPNTLFSIMQLWKKMVVLMSTHSQLKERTNLFCIMPSWGMI